MDEGNLTTNLTETKRSEDTNLDLDVLDRLGGEEEVVELLELSRDVIGVVVTGDECGGEDLVETVELLKGERSFSSKRDLPKRQHHP